MRSEQAQATYDAILRAAKEEFAEQGFDATHLSSIADRTGVTQPLINHYFGTKEALITEVLRQAMLDYDAAQGAQWSLPACDVRFFTEGLEVFFDWLGANRVTLRLVLWARLQGRLPQLAEADALMAKVHARFADAQRAGILRNTVDVEATIVLIEALFKGFWERADRLPDIDELAPRVFRQSMDLLLEGLLTDAALAEALSIRGRATSK